MIKFLKERIRMLSLGHRLTLTMWLTQAVPVFILFAIISAVVFADLVKNAESRAEAVLEQTISHVDRRISMAEERIFAFATDLNLNEAIRNYDKENYKSKLIIRDFIHNSIMDVYSLDTDVVNVALYLAGSQNYFTSSFEDSGTYHRHDTEAWFQDILSGASNIYKGWLKTYSGNDIYLISVPVKNVQTGDVLGLAYIEISSQSISNMINDFLPEEDNVIWKGENSLLLGADRENGVLSVFGEANELELNLEYRLSLTNDIRMILIVAASLLIGIFVLTLLLFQVCSLFSRWFTGRIVVLRNATSNLAHGSLGLSVVDEYNDELTDLANGFNQMSIQIKQLIEDNYLSQIRNQEAQLIALQSQINPHFIYNTLESISMMALLNDNYEIVDMAQAFSHMMRYSMQNDAQVSVSDEIENVECYLSIQDIRFSHKVRTEIEVQEGCGNLPLLRLTLQPLVENCFAHGFEKQSEGGRLRLVIRAGKKWLRIFVIDDGVGIGREKLAKIRELIKCGNTSTGWDCYALRNLSQRLKLSYGESAEMHIRSNEGQGTCVLIRIPINYDGQVLNEKDTDL